jgi:hypothetical protein
MQQFFNTMKITENQLRKENEDMKYKMNEMMIYNNQLHKINNEMMWLKQEMKNKEIEIEHTKTLILKPQKEKQQLIREKNIIYIERPTETGKKNRLIKEGITLIEKQKQLIPEKDTIDTFRFKETFDKNKLQKEIKEREEIIQELENNLLKEKYEKQTLAREQKQLHEKYNMINEKCEQLKQ